MLFIGYYGYYSGLWHLGSGFDSPWPPHFFTNPFYISILFLSIMSHIQTAEDWMEQFFGGAAGNIEKRGYRLRVAVAGPRVTPRDNAFELLRELGSNYLEPILHQKPIGEPYVTLVYPERWLSVHEQRYLVTALDNHPEVKSGTVTAVDILTQNPLIVGSCWKEELVIFQMEGSRGLITSELEAIAEGKKTADQLYKALSKKQS